MPERSYRTYEARREEGRTKHGQTSMIAIFTGFVSLLLLEGSICFPSWRTSYHGTALYSQTRSWGLFQVMGVKVVLHHQAAATSCQAFGDLNVGGICNTPICLWYQLKCITYSEFMLVSYGIGFFLMLSGILHVMCLYWTLKFTPRLIRWAASWWPVVTLVHIAGLTTWMIYTEIMFPTLDAQSVYPTPPPGVGFVGSVVGCLLLLTNCVLGCMLMRMWPEVDLSDLSDELDEGSDDEGDNEFLKGKKKAAAGHRQQDIPPQGYGPQGYPAQGYDPGAYSLAGYDPQAYAAQGYDPQAYAAPGYAPQGYDPQGYESYPPADYALDGSQSQPPAESGGAPPPASAVQPSSRGSTGSGMPTPHQF